MELESIAELIDVRTNRYYLLSNLGDAYEPRSLVAYIKPYSDNSLGLQVKVNLDYCIIEFKCGISYRGKEVK